MRGRRDTRNRKLTSRVFTNRIGISSGTGGQSRDSTDTAILFLDGNTRVLSTVVSARKLVDLCGVRQRIFVDPVSVFVSVRQDESRA